MTDTWSAPKTGRFLEREWEDECAIMDLLSGDTHFLDALSCSILHSLRDGDASIEDLALASNAGYALNDQATLLLAINHTLINLERLGLAERLVN